MKPRGFILYRGPSLIDGTPIVAVAITESGNRKTGNMVQTYILPAGIRPNVAARIGADRAVCGDCTHRPINGGACYVVLGQGPTQVFKGLARGAYPYDPDAAARAAAGRMVRLGTYGEPAAVPAHVWRELIANASGHTGYTHQWARDDMPREHLDDILSMCMASADSADDARILRAQGRRYFRVRREDESIRPGEIVCPASEEAGKRKTCAECGACNGTDERGARKASVTIIVHGAKRARFSHSAA